MDNHCFECRSCGSKRHKMILDFGDVPLANAFVTGSDDTTDKKLYPLSLVMCEDCRLLQIRDSVPREDLFSNYLWVTATSAGAKSHAEWLSRRLWNKFGGLNNGKPFLVEVASNDGFFLRRYREVGFDILGVDPSNIAEEANANGLPSIRDFFGQDVATRIIESHGTADLIVARNVLGHCSELQDLVSGIATLLSPEGSLILEVPYAYLIRERTQYDYIFHEHLSYFTVGSLQDLLSRYNLKISDIQFVDMNGGSLLCEIVHASDSTPSNHETMLAFENFIHLNETEGWTVFANDVQRQREQFVSTLKQLNDEGCCVVAYGAAARFMTMLNYCNIGTDLIKAVADANPRKQGLLCPGVHIPVVSPNVLLELDPDYIIIGAWNFKEEIINKVKDEFGYKNSFITPLPRFEVTS